MNSFMNLIEPLFAFVVESSLAACIAVVVILVLQRVFRARFSPRWHYLLWSLLVLRLMLPWMPESPVSAERLFRFASHETVISSPEVHRDFAANRFVPFTDNAPESAREATASPVAPSVPIKPVRRPLDLSRVMKSVWLAGCLLFGLHIVTVSWRMSRNWRTTTSRSRSSAGSFARA